MNNRYKCELCNVGVKVGSHVTKAQAGAKLLGNVRAEVGTVECHTKLRHRAGWVAGGTNTCMGVICAGEGGKAGACRGSRSSLRGTGMVIRFGGRVRPAWHACHSCTSRHQCKRSVIPRSSGLADGAVFGHMDAGCPSVQLRHRLLPGPLVRRDFLPVGQGARALLGSGLLAASEELPSARFSGSGATCGSIKSKNEIQRMGRSAQLSFPGAQSLDRQGAAMPFHGMGRIG